MFKLIQAVLLMDDINENEQQNLMSRGSGRMEQGR